jgi:hypothetical protein
MKPEDKAVVQQALEAMEYHTVQTRPLTRTQEAMDALRQLLEQPEPVPLTPHQICEMGLVHGMSNLERYYYEQGVLDAEFHHGITTPPAQPEPVFCEYCGGNDDADFGLPTDHCTDCDRPDPAQPESVQEEKQSEIFCGVDFADGVLSVSVLRRRPNDVAELLHSEQIELPLSAQPADHGDELTIAYLDGVHTGKQIARREWVGLTPEQIRACFFAGEPPASSPPHWWEYRNPDYMAIYSNIDAKLREKNGGGA